MTASVCIDICDTRLDSELARELIGELDAELAAAYPEEGANHFRLDPDEVGPGRGAFVVATADSGSPLGCGAVRVIAPDVAELKRMYVRPTGRGLGVGAALLAALEQRAVALGARRLLLETGVRQEAALRLYARAGFRRVASFGEYVDSPLSVCLAKSLTTGMARPAGVVARRMSGVPLD